MPFRPFDSGVQWWGFIDALVYQNRFVTLDEWVAELIRGCKKSIIQLPAGTSLFRARIEQPGGQWRQNPSPWTTDAVLTPTPSEVAFGRLNPEGMPYLYLTLESLTAIAESRPWRDAEVTVAPLRTRQALSLYDLKSLQEPTLDDLDRFLLTSIAEIFALPANRVDRTEAWANQFISEQLKAASPEVHGVHFPSALASGGTNVALFGGKGRPAGFTDLVEIDGNQTRWKVTNANVDVAPI